MFIPTNEEIHDKLKEAFGVEVYYGLNEEITDPSFFSYFPVSIDPTEKCIWKQDIDIFYISMKQEDLKEKEIYNVLRNMKLKVMSITYDRVGLVDKNAYFDVVKFSCRRNERFNCA